jgi:predicted anti-sigma-YlaC factor YlaD
MAHQTGLPRAACKELEQDLVLYYYSELNDNNQKRMEGHLESCPSCRFFLEELKSLLPLTLKSDEPPTVFWENYTREVSAALAKAEENVSWWSQLSVYFRPWPLPALATALVIMIAVTFTLTKRPWRTQDLPPTEEALLEAMPIAENLEFFKAMEFLDAMDLLESMGGPSNGSA